MIRIALVRWASLAVLMAILGGCAQQPLQHRDPAFKPVSIPDTRAEEKAPTGAIFDPDDRRGLFEDAKAFRVGDLLTVVLEEQTNASKSATTTTNKGSSLDMGAPTIFNHPMENLSASAESNRSFNGQGDSAQSNELEGTVSVMVSRVLPNGNLEIRGEKMLTLNRGSEHVRISGMIRPQDIRPDNSISSTKVANANIIYSGNGAIAESNRMGWLTRFFNSPLWPL